MSNKSRTVFGVINLPSPLLAMINENSTKVTSFKSNGAMVTQNNDVSPQPNQPQTNSIIPSLTLTGFGS